MAVGTRCPDPETGQPHPYGPPEGRWILVGRDGFADSFFDSAEEAREHWAEMQAQELLDYRDTIPARTQPSGFHGFWIEYSSASAPVDEVQVIVHTLAVRDVVLRGLMRNRSRTLWAYGVVVKAEGRRWRWPLSVRPGEAAPFEIEGFHETADPRGIEITITAEMSNDMDLSRYVQFYTPGQYDNRVDDCKRSGIPGEDYDLLIPPQVSARLSPCSAQIREVAFGLSENRLFNNYGTYGDLPPGTPKLAILPKRGMSHPGSGGYWELDKHYPRQAWVAWISHDDGTVLDIAQAPLFSSGDIGRLDDSVGTEPFVYDRVFHPEYDTYLPLRIAFDHRAAGTTDPLQGWITWAGGPHPVSP